MSTSLGIEQKYALVTRRLEVQTETTVQQLHAVLSRREVVKYQWSISRAPKPDFSLGIYVTDHCAT